MGIGVSPGCNQYLRLGGRIHFNLDGVDIAEALAGDPDVFVGRYTAYELQQIVGNAEWFDNTTFYRDSQRLTIADLKDIGITPPAGNDS